jgi:hypothetical protein
MELMQSLLSQVWEMCEIPKPIKVNCRAGDEELMVTDESPIYCLGRLANNT